MQRKCFQEIRDVIGDDVTKPVTLNDLNNLNYLDLVIKETLRLFPSVPLIGRELHEEVDIGKNMGELSLSRAVKFFNFVSRQVHLTEGYKRCHSNLFHGT